MWGDDSLLEEVRSLLAQESGGLLDSPALDAAARALADEKGARELPDLVGQTLQHYRIEEKIGRYSLDASGIDVQAVYLSAIR
jgi:hypothetical protein